MKFGTQTIKVFDYLNAKYQLPTTTPTLDFETECEAS